MGFADYDDRQKDICTANQKFLILGQRDLRNSLLPRIRSILVGIARPITIVAQELAVSQHTPRPQHIRRAGSADDTSSWMKQTQGLYAIRYYLNLQG